MLTDIEIDSLAKEVLTRILLDERAAPLFLEIMETEAGELIPVFGGISEDGYGAIRCEYTPHQAIKKIVVICERMFDEYASQFHESAYSPRDRAIVIEAMADSAVLHLIASFNTRLRHLLEDAVEESYLIASGFIAASTAKHLTQKQHQQGQLAADIRPGIEKVAARAADKRKALLRQLLKGLPHLVVERKRGAPIKSQGKRQSERDAYIAIVEDTYRRLRLENRKPPTKTKVAKEIGEGGINPKTGIDSSLPAFRNKLQRLGIDYDAIAKKVERELNNN